MVNSFPYYNRVSFVLRKCTNHFRNMNSEVKLMICVDQNGQAVEISVADQMWLDDAYFKGKQMHRELHWLIEYPQKGR